MNLSSPLLRKFITLGRIDNERIKQHQDSCRCAAELVIRCAEIGHEEFMAQCVELFQVPAFDLRGFTHNHVDKSQLKENLIRRHRIFPIGHNRERLTLAVSDPTDLDAIENYEFSSGMRCEAVLADYRQIDELIEHFFDATHALKRSHLQQDELGTHLEHVEDTPLEESIQKEDDAPIIVYVNKILDDAIRRGASDLHFEPYEGEYRIRFRIDGVLHEIAHPPYSLATRLAARIKIMAKLDISEKRVPQDGRIKVAISKRRKIDFRVSTLPTLWGEKIVMRLLDSSSTSLGIDILGYESEQKAAYLRALAQPQGMILVTGPTGSGKTVSLYTGLNILNTPERNISTAEDPVEINLKGVNQVQINPKAKLTFANALRAFLRQDPDVVMVGEIRDLETAEIAIKAAQTGHLVLSTLHTNSAAETITRLLNMGVPAYNVASSVSLIIAQRLARKLCDHCKEPETLPEHELLKQGFTKEQLQHSTLYKAKGCEHCTDGFKGRTGLYEVMKMTPAIAQAIMDGELSNSLAQHADESFYTLRVAGLKKVAAGVTSLNELNRVTTF